MLKQTGMKQEINQIRKLKAQKAEFIDGSRPKFLCTFLGKEMETAN